MTSIKEFVKTSLRFADPKKVRFEYDRFHDSLNFYVDGMVYKNVEPVKPFPLSAPYYVILRVEPGKDLCVIRDIRGLEESSRKALEYVLDRKYFIPVIRRVLGITYTGEFFVCKVETDKGVKTFKLRGRRRSVFRMDDKIVLFDMDENIYLIESYEKLDQKSKEELMKLL